MSPRTLEVPFSAPFCTWGQGGCRRSSLGLGCFSTGSVPLPPGVPWAGKGFPRGRFLRQEKFHSRGSANSQWDGRKCLLTSRGDDTAARRPGPPPTDTAQAEVALGTLQSVGLPTGGRHTQDRCLAQKVFPLMCVISDPVCWATGIDWLASPESKAKKRFSINLLLPDPPRPREFGSTEPWVLEGSCSRDDSLGTKAGLDF